MFANHTHANLPVECLHLKINTSAVVGDRKSRRMVLAGEHSTASQAIEERAGVPTWNKHTLAQDAVLIGPLDSNPVRSVLTRKAKHARQTSGPHALQANETDADQ